MDSQKHRTAFGYALRRYHHSMSTNGRHMPYMRPRNRNPGSRPHPQGFNGPRPPPIRFRGSEELRRSPILTLKIRGLPSRTATWDICENFGQYGGTIVLVELFTDNLGRKEGNARVRFEPPPSETFWDSCDAQGYFLMKFSKKELPNGENLDDETCRVHISIDEHSMRQSQQKNMIQSPVNKTKWYPSQINLKALTLKFGFLLSPEEMASMHTVQKTGSSDLHFTLNLQRRKVQVSFKLDIVDPRDANDKDAHSLQSATFSEADPVETGKYNRTQDYKFSIPFDAIKTIYRTKISDDEFALIFPLQSPPQFFFLTGDAQSTHPPDSTIWVESDQWIRQTDIVYDVTHLIKSPIALKHDEPVIDIGRWTTYFVTFTTEQGSSESYIEFKEALQDFNIEITDKSISVCNEPPPNILSSLAQRKDQQLFSEHLQSLDDSSAIPLPFEVQYQLQVCISRGMLNEHNITKEFTCRLAEIASTDSTKAKHILEFIADQDTRLYNPMEIFDNEIAMSYTPRTNIPHYCAYSRKATVTPTTIYYSSPTVETTNRVLRRFDQENKDGRFLRVQFTDELFEGRINPCANKERDDELYIRVYRTLLNGIQIGERHYEFLAFGNAQFRQNGAYFYCPTEHLSCDDIRNWMGNFSHINVVAKFAARLGQCFSTTRAIKGLSKPEVVRISDIERNGFCFTDGVGKISPFLATMIANELGIKSENPPSAFQIRLGGCKGILVTWADAKNREVHIRKSQQKFNAIYNGLEIIRWSKFSCASLNRQTITILSALGVKDTVFIEMMDQQLGNYQRAMDNTDLAVKLLSEYVDDNHMTINIANMIRNGFMTQREPFVKSLLHLWRAWSIKLLKEKARLIVEEGAFVLGCVDETATLKGYTKPVPRQNQSYPSSDELPQIFLQIPDRVDPTVYKVVEGVCLVGRNPSLHPGDIRVVMAVNVPALRHLRDVVVFPQTGERDIPSMCSGGDLDGDDFFIIWDKALHPPEWHYEPMNYTGPTPKSLNRPVGVTDMMRFFVRYMKNDSLPTIAQAHMAQADILASGVKDPKCLELAMLHSKAVDYVKTGEPADMPKRLRPTRWPQFMESKFRSKNSVYNSEKILGQLYDQVDRIDFVPQWEEPFDERILKAYKLESSTLQDARQTKTKYDTAMLRIMAQQEIKTEFEVWSTFVLSRPRVGTDYKVQEEMAIISGALKETFRTECIQMAGGRDFEVLGPFVAAMYQVTKEELDFALDQCNSKKTVDGVELPRRKMEPRSMPLISFPWLFERELGRIALSIEEASDIVSLALPNSEPSKSQPEPAEQQEVVKDYIECKDGVIIHRGEELNLFASDSESDNDFCPTDSDEKSHNEENSGSDLDTLINLTDSNKTWLGSAHPYRVPESLREMSDYYTNRLTQPTSNTRRKASAESSYEVLENLDELHINDTMEKGPTTGVSTKENAIKNPALNLETSSFISTEMIPELGDLEPGVQRSGGLESSPLEAGSLESVTTNEPQIDILEDSTRAEIHFETEGEFLEAAQEEKEKDGQNRSEQIDDTGNEEQEEEVITEAFEEVTPAIDRLTIMNTN